MATMAWFVTVRKSGIRINDEVSFSQGISVIISKMKGSKKGSSDLTYSSLGDEVPVVTVPFESSSGQGVNIKKSSGESSKEQVSNMVGWIVHKMYGIHEVKGVVQSYNSETNIYEVLYEDDKSEKVTRDSLLRYLSPCSPEDDKQSENAKPAIINASNAGQMAPAEKATKRKRAGTATAKQSKQASQGSGGVTAANSRSRRAGTATAKQSKQASQGSGEVTAASSTSKRTGIVTTKQSKQASQGSGEVTAANTRRRTARTPTAKQSKQASQGSGEVTSANSTSKRAGTVTAKQSKQASQGSGEVPAANSSNAGKTRYRSLRMNAGR